MSSIIALPELIAVLPATERRRVERLLSVTRAVGQAVVPPSMHTWVTQRFGDPATVERQQVVRVRNQATLDEALFNPLRAHRPLGQAQGDLEQVIAAGLAQNTDFLQPAALTTADPFGRIQGQFCMSASNVAKFEQWHGLVIFDEAHPLHFGPAQVRDYLDVALRWLQAAHNADSRACYPLIIWNCLPRSGASIVHGHLQMALASDQHYAQVERWHRAALTYGQRQGYADCAGYFDELCAAHGDLGLSCYSRDAVRGFVSLTPARNREVVLLAPKMGFPLTDGLARVLRALIDILGVRAFNAAIYLPPFGATPEDWRGFPVVVRVADRGNPLSHSSDLGAIEIFASNVITADPFEVAAELQPALA